jgi:hypothetical protein
MSRTITCERQSTLPSTWCNLGAYLDQIIHAGSSQYLALQEDTSYPAWVLQIVWKEASTLVTQNCHLAPQPQWEQYNTRSHSLLSDADGRGYGGTACNFRRDAAQLEIVDLGTSSLGGQTTVNC